MIIHFHTKNQALIKSVETPGPVPRVGEVIYLAGDNDPMLRESYSFLVHNVHYVYNASEEEQMTAIVECHQGTADFRSLILREQGWVKD